MTEAEWIAATDPYDMLMSFPAKWDHRKLWLFGCACLRRVWHLLKDQRSRSCVEVAERLVDSHASEQEAGATWEEFDAAANAGTLDSQWLDTHEAIRSLVCFVDPASSLQLAYEVAEGVGAFAAESVPVTPPATWTETFRKAEREERTVQVKLLRDIFANPFRPVAADPGWLTPKVVTLARTIYEDRAFDRIPLLADALEEAGCNDADILAHCLQPGEHVRACWVVDGRGPDLGQGVTPLPSWVCDPLRDEFLR
jgi:hypothetical protein